MKEYGRVDRKTRLLLAKNLSREEASKDIDKVLFVYIPDYKIEPEIGQRLSKDYTEFKDIQNSDVSELLDLTDWKVTRHRDEIDLGLMTSLTAEEYEKLLKDRNNWRLLANQEKGQHAD